MPQRNGNSREEALRKNNTLNARAQEVKDEMFREGGFFDPRDMVQVKYEMLRRVREQKLSVTGVAASFGFSRVSYYQALRAFEQEGMAGLLPRQRGPRHAHKLTEPVMSFIRACLQDQPHAKTEDLVELIQQEFNLSIHVRSIERALVRAKKNS